MGIFISVSRRSSHRFARLPFLLLMVTVVIAPRVVAQWNSLNPVHSLQRDDAGVTLNLERGALRFQVCSETIIRVLYSPQHEFPHVAEYVVIKTDWPKTDFLVNETASDVALSTARLKVVVAKKDSSIVFYDAAGKKLAAENDRTM